MLLNGENNSLAHSYVIERGKQLPDTLNVIERGKQLPDTLNIIERGKQLPDTLTAALGAP